MKFSCHYFFYCKIMQSFLKLPHFNKNFFYKQPQDRYQEFCNAYAYYKQATLCDPKLNRQKLIEDCLIVWKEVKKNDATLIENKIREYYIHHMRHTSTPKYTSTRNKLLDLLIL